ncbi:hypothetical protein PR202_gb25561 [Eleusine coracana subsp. coracana]|uniref:MATH domain-containing protein n=1 Tax=Eleusine coracana subsp. coracana TaxID=191504 RepID=A0AAV5FPA3_ELECO|nr:hypothetical protein PR202_gb25561 [Eleusine coracana subsp. coracana]
MPTPTTVSICNPETDHGKHVFEIYGYSEYRIMCDGEYIRSGAFSVGGFDWAIRFYPDGWCNYGNIWCSPICLELLSNNSKLQASCELSLVDQTTGLPLVKKIGLTRFDSCSDRDNLARWHYIFSTKSEFDKSPYLQDDHLTIQCTVNVRKPRVSATEFLNRVEAPLSNITQQLGKLLDT